MVLGMSRVSSTTEMGCLPHPARVRVMTRLEHAERAGLDIVRSNKGIENSRREVARQGTGSCFLCYCQHWPTL